MKVKTARPKGKSKGATAKVKRSTPKTHPTRPAKKSHTRVSNLSAWSPKQSSRWLFGGTIAVVVITFFSLLVWNNHALNQTGSATPTQTFTFQYAHHPALGSATAPVKVVEFGDFKCSTCKAWHSMVFPKFKKQYIDTGKVQFYFFSFPVISPDSYTALEAGDSIEAQNPKAFWTFYNQIYDHQESESKPWATPQHMVQLISKYVKGVNTKQVMKDLEDKKYLPEVKADIAAGTKADVTGTPTLFVNGKQVPNEFNYNQLESMIQAASAR